MSYVDGFVLPVPKDRLDDYRKIAQRAGAIWMEHGAVAYFEGLADDVPYGQLTSFPRSVQVTEDETVVFSYIVYKSREERDAINKKVMADERLQADMKDIPVDGKRMIFGGFSSLVEL